MKPHDEDAIGTHVRKLQRLVDKAYQLRNQPPLDRDFRHWQRDALRIVTEIYGPESSKAEFFKNIRFKVGGERNFSRKNQQMINNGLSNSVSINNVDDGYYRQILSDAVETLQTIIYSLQTQKM